MVHLLRRIAIQTESYTLSSMYLNATSHLPDLPPFRAPEWAVRVNGLWFASLVVSLATASLSMLVKQWLREYLAMDWASPQDRVRARQYRRPAMDDWKVFEIAAILPVLLQVSLGLFFTGLCFFTASVDLRMGRPTLLLVVGWAFFVVFTTLSPLFSPRCPYKMPLFKSIMRVARRNVTMRPRVFVTTHAMSLMKALSPESCETSAGNNDEHTTQSRSRAKEEDEAVKSTKDDADTVLLRPNRRTV